MNVSRIVFKDEVNEKDADKSMFTDNWEESGAEAKFRSAMSTLNGSAGSGDCVMYSSSDFFCF